MLPRCSYTGEATRAAYVVCPPCGTVFEGESEADVIRTTQLHSKEKHDYVLPREEILGAMTSTPPPSGEEERK